MTKVLRYVRVMYTSTPRLDIQFSGDGTPIAANLSGYTPVMETTAVWSSETPSVNGLSQECKAFLAERGGNISQTTNVHDPPIRVVISSITFVENLLVIIALLHSWRNLRQNIYIFALSIACSDCFLGLIHVVNSVVVNALTNEVRKSDVYHMGARSWFYLIRATALTSAQVASTGNAACLVIAFKRYVTALAPGGVTSQAATSASASNSESTSMLLSRKTSYAMTAGVWTISLILGIIPLCWNCGEECACFINVGINLTDEDAVRCFENHGCSSMFPPLKSLSYLLTLGLFFITMGVLVITCIQVIIGAGGIIALLPYRLHKYYARKRRRSAEDPTNIPMRLRKRSVQMTYMRDMMHFMIAISLTFVICKLPSATLLLVESVTRHGLNISSDWATFMVLLGYSDSILNPIIFAATLHGMKEAFKKLVEPCCVKTLSVSIGKQLHSAEEENPSQQQRSTTV